MSVIIPTIQDEHVAEVLTAGKVGVVPSDTQYGLMASARIPEAVEHLYKVKGRETKPGTLIAASIDQLVELGFKARYLKACEQFWPNPISVIIPAGAELAFLHRGKFGVAVRIPGHSAVRMLLERTGPLMTTSANAPGETPASTIQEAQGYFGDAADFYVDGGDLSGHPPSTIIRMVDDAVEVIRQGAVTVNEETGEIVA